MNFLLSLILAFAPFSPYLAQMFPGPGGNVTSAGSNTEFITVTSVTTLRNDITGCVGFKLTVGGSPVTVASLGRWVVSGNSGTHAVSILDASGNTIISANVDTSGATAGTFKYASITPTALSASTDYFIASDETNGGDQWYSSDTVFTNTGVATVVESSYRTAACGTGAMTGSSANNIFVPVNFKY